MSKEPTPEEIQQMAERYFQANYGGTRISYMIRNHVIWAYTAACKAMIKKLTE